MSEKIIHTISTETVTIKLPRASVEEIRLAAERMSQALGVPCPEVIDPATVDWSGVTVQPMLLVMPANDGGVTAIPAKAKP